MSTSTLIELDAIHLSEGAHRRPEDGMCLLEAVAYIQGQPFNDHPACVSPVLGDFGRRLNDALPDGPRQQLKALIPLLPGTADDGQDEARSYLALDWRIRTYTPAWLDLAGLREEAAALRGLRRIADLVAAAHASPVVEAASLAASAARDAGDAGDAWAAAWAAAWTAAWTAAGDAAGDAWTAAWAAARDALAPTVAELQQSAIVLFTAMIHPAVAA